MNFERIGSAHERVLSVIYDYLVDLEKPARPCYKIGRFELLSYSRWAADELICRIIDNSASHPIIILEDFVCEMWKYSQTGRANSYIFEIAQSVGEDILDVYRAME